MISTKYILLSLFFLTSITTLSYAGLGELAGGMNFNVSVGSRQSLNLTIFNSGNGPVGYEASLIQLSTIPNESTPVVTIIPANGILQAHQQQLLNVTVYFPPYQRVDPGLNWTGLIQVLEITNNSNAAGGVVISAGVAKVISITSSKQVIQVIISSSPPTQQQNPFKIIYESVGAIVIIIVLIAIYYIYMHKRTTAPSTRKERRSK
jgi:hypothetical protein